jgi:hypothetical protein
VGERWRSSDGEWSVRLVRLNGTPNHGDGEWLRLTRFGFWVADVRTVAELADFVSLDRLWPGPVTGSRRGSR